MALIQESKDKKGFEFNCPACQMVHSFPKDRAWNKDADNPTLAQPLIITGHRTKGGNRVGYRCHLTIVGGVAKYYQDCTHKYADKELQLTPFK